MNSRSRDAWALASIFAVLLVGGWLLASPPTRKEIKVSTTYNPDPRGVKAFYTLLGERLGYRVDRLRSPYTEIPRAARVIFVVQPRSRAGDAGNALPFGQPYYITNEERDALADWVRRGGAAVFISDGLSGVPAAFGTDQEMGKGRVYAFSSRSVITNRGMRDHRNALVLLKIIDRHAGKQGLVLFDEYHHGIEESRSLWSYVSRQVKVAGLILVVAGLVFCHSQGRRFGAVRATSATDTLRPGYEFVEAVARLYQRSGSTDVAAAILCRSFRQALSARLGLAGDASVDRLTTSLAAIAGGDAAARARGVLTRCESSEAGHKPAEHELLEMMREIRELEKELGLERIGA